MILTKIGAATPDLSAVLPSVGHELRNPLSSILAQAETLEDGLHGPVSPAQKAVLQSIQKEVHRTLALVADLADLGRMECGTFLLSTTPCHLPTLQQQVLGEMTPAAEARSVRLIAAEVPEAMVHTDAARLHQVICEMVSAILLVAPIGGEVWLSIRKQDSHISLQTGTGLSMSEFEALAVNPSQDADIEAALQRLLSLRPLGITLARRLVHLQGGTFNLKASAPHSLALCVRLPLAGQTAELAPSDQTPSSLTQASIQVPDRTPIILIADDQATLVTVTTHFLENLGFEVHAARDGQEAVQMAQQLKPDLILMDVRMPVLEGPQAIQAIRRSDDPHLKTMPIISLSGQPGPADRERCLAAGASAHLSKPFGVKELDAAIRQFVTPPA